MKIGRAVVIGSPAEVRVEAFGRAWAAAGHAPAVVVAYADLLGGVVDLREVVTAGALVRIESPGKDEASNRALLALGADEPDEEGAWTLIDPVERARKGRLGGSRQWYRGLRAFLRRVAGQLAGCPPHTLMNSPDEISVMFDKRACHARLAAAGVCVPAALPPVMSFEQLRAEMDAAGVRRVFVKPAHGSSAAGVVAYQTNGRDHRATAAVEMVPAAGAVQLYNTRAVRTYDSHADVAALIDAVCKERVHVEQWIPKPQMDGKAFDLRVVVIAGRAAHTVARLSRTPMTNLHLRNERRDRAAVIAHIGEAHFDAAMHVCCAAMACFPNSLYAGVDLLLAPGFTRGYVLEMNAFGDLLHNVWFEGVDTYTLELERVGDGRYAPYRRDA